MELTFQIADEFVIVKIFGHNVLFANSTTNFQQFVPIDNIKLSEEGILKEFPDLKGKENIKQEAIRRFKEHISKLGGDENIKNYVIEELGKQGYILKAIKKEGFRIQKT